MKSIGTFIKTTILAITLFCSQLATAQKTDQQDTDMAAIVNSGNFIFKAQTMVPSRGMSRPLNYDYDVRITPDKVLSYLPYFGRVFNAVNPSEGPLHFTSTDFAYKVKTNKKGWQVSVKPKDVRTVREYNFRVMKEGSSTLMVSSNTMQSISFYGNIVPGQLD